MTSSFEILPILLLLSVLACMFSLIALMNLKTYVSFYKDSLDILVLCDMGTSLYFALMIYISFL